LAPLLRPQTVRAIRRIQTGYRRGGRGLESRPCRGLPVPDRGCRGAIG